MAMVSGNMVRGFFAVSAFVFFLIFTFALQGSNNNLSKEFSVIDVNEQHIGLFHTYNSNTEEHTKLKCKDHDDPDMCRAIKAFGYITFGLAISYCLLYIGSLLNEESRTMIQLSKIALVLYIISGTIFFGMLVADVRDAKKDHDGEDNGGFYTSVFVVSILNLAAIAVSEVAHQFLPDRVDSPIRSMDMGGGMHGNTMYAMFS